MNGQWLGQVTGTNSGQVILELDDEGDHFAGVAYLYDDNMRMPSIYADIRTPSKSNEFNIKLNLTALHSETSNPISREDLQKIYPDAILSETADTKWHVAADTIEVDWKTGAPTAGTVRFTKTEAGLKSQYRPSSIVDWKGFKEYVTTLDPYRYIFRGQTNANWRLRTHFHRTGRANLLKFMNRDIPELYNLLTSQTKHIFDLANAVENGAFYSLAQHHGYPTPLLDWTHSPFIAAYFAYKNLPKNERDSSRKVRIFLFDRARWETSFNQVQKLSPARPHFSVLRALAINNPRMVPQQAILTVTNLDDIESYIRKREQETGTQFLTVIDLPSDERKEVMQELALMGITAGSLFPGLDGACEQLRERFFDL